MSENIDRSVESPLSDDLLNFLNENLLQNGDKKTKVKYGNTEIEKGTDEYYDMRDRNNESIKNCRLKKKKELEQMQQETEVFKKHNLELFNEIEQLKLQLQVYHQLVQTANPSQLSEFNEKYQQLMKKYEELKS